MNETDSQRVYNYPFYPRDSINYSDKVSVNIDDAIMAGNHLTFLYQSY